MLVCKLVHVPLQQVCPGPHTVPHTPQLNGLLGSPLGCPFANSATQVGVPLPIEVAPVDSQQPLFVPGPQQVLPQQEKPGRQQAPPQQVAPGEQQPSPPQQKFPGGHCRPQDPQFWELVCYVASVKVDKGGQFEFINVGPGKYRLFAWTDLDKVEYRSRKYLSAFREKSTDVTVDDKTQATGIQLSLLEPKE